MLNFPSNLTRNISSHSMENLIITLPFLTTSLIHFSFKVWENVLFELGSEVEWSCSHVEI